MSDSPSHKPSRVVVRARDRTRCGQQLRQPSSTSTSNWTVDGTARGLVHAPRHGWACQRAPIGAIYMGALQRPHQRGGRARHGLQCTGLAHGRCTANQRAHPVPRSEHQILLWVQVRSNRRDQLLLKILQRTMRIHVYLRSIVRGVRGVRCCGVAVGSVCSLVGGAPGQQASLCTWGYGQPTWSPGGP